MLQQRLLRCHLSQLGQALAGVEFSELLDFRGRLFCQAVFLILVNLLQGRGDEAALLLPRDVPPDRTILFELRQLGLAAGPGVATAPGGPR